MKKDRKTHFMKHQNNAKELCNEERTNFEIQVVKLQGNKTSVHGHGSTYHKASGKIKVASSKTLCHIPDEVVTAEAGR